MRLFPTALSLLALACGSALAQPVEEPEAIAPGTLIAFSEYDLDSNGTVTLAEFTSLLPAEHTRAARACDTNGDGTLAQSEYDACAGYPPSDAATKPR